MIKMFTDKFAMDCQLMMPAKNCQTQKLPANILFTFKFKSK